MMQTAAASVDLIEKARLTGKSIGLWSNGYDYKASARQLFGDIDLSGKAVLEVGCGTGVYCVWAAIHGAHRVVGLEPVSDGSRSDECVRRFRQFVDDVGVSNVECLPLRLQDYRAETASIDIVLSVASINHLDESSTIALRNSVSAQETYEHIFRDLHRVLKRGGKIIIADASSRNVFGDFGVRNPFTPTVDWKKHQPPEVWASLLERCGFGDTRISWLSGRALRHCGIFRLHEKLSYVGSSVFRLEMTRM